MVTTLVLVCGIIGVIDVEDGRHGGGVAHSIWKSWMYETPASGFFFSAPPLIRFGSIGASSFCSFLFILIFFFYLKLFFSCRRDPQVLLSSKWRVPSWHFLIETLRRRVMQSKAAVHWHRSQSDGDDEKRRDPFSQEINHHSPEFNPRYMLDIYL